MGDKLIYLASPYSDADPAVERLRFEAVCAAAALLIRNGVLVFSPIAHSHPIALCYQTPQKDWAFWAHLDRALLRRCDEVWVLMLPGWERSFGVRAELRLAHEYGKPVRLVAPTQADGVRLETYPINAVPALLAHLDGRAAAPTPDTETIAIDEGQR